MFQGDHFSGTVKFPDIFLTLCGPSMHVMFFLFNNIFLSLLPGRYKHHTKNVQYHLISWQILLKGWCKAHNSLLNTSSPKLEACNKQFSAAKFPLAFPWLFHHIWSIPSLFPNSSQIPWHCQVSTRVLLVLVDVEGEVDLGHLCRLWEWAASQSGKEDLRLGHVWVTVRLRLCPHLSASTPQHGRRLHIRNPPPRCCCCCCCYYYYYYYYTHLTASFPGLPGPAGTRKVKPI